MTLLDQPQVVPVVDFTQPEGFTDSYTAEMTAAARTIFVARPSVEAGNHCTYLLSEDGKRIYLPNTVKCFLNHAEIVTVNYENEMYSSQEKLLMHFTSVGGDAFVWRTGALSYASSSLVLGLTHLNSTALTGQVEITWSAKGAAVFARVASAVNDGFIPVALPQEALGYRLSFDELQDGLTFINQSINSGDAVPPRFFSEAPADEPDVLEQLRAPAKRRRKTATSADAPVTA